MIWTCATNLITRLLSPLSYISVPNSTRPHIAYFASPASVVNLDTFHGRHALVHSYLTLDSELSPPLNLMLFMKQHPMHAFRPELRMPPPLSPEGQPVQPPQEKSFVQKYWVYMAIGLVGLCECFFSSLKAAPSSRVFFFFLCGLLALQTITTRLSKNPLHLENKLVYPS